MQTIGEQVKCMVESYIVVAMPEADNKFIRR